jgi:hypothetical protein
MSDSARPLVARLSEALALERRGTARYEFDSESATPLPARCDGTDFPVRIQDLSAGGLALLADRRIEPGTLLSVDLPTRDEFGTRRLVMRVRFAAALSADTWKIGCEFGRLLSANELLALL